MLQIAKKHADAGIRYAEALDEALCYGWIDGIRRRLDADSFTIRFTPRKPRSIWSRVNVAHVERLIREKRMTKAGLAAFEARTDKRTAIYAYEQRPTELPPPLRRKFRQHGPAWKYFQTEAPHYQRTASDWVMSAKREETQIRRLEVLIACSAEGLRIPQLRRP